MSTKIDPPVISFQSAPEWEVWLANNHANSMCIWLRFFKKGSGQPTVTYDEALAGALCYGWIDGQVKKYDELSWLQKFTPRRARSVWSKRNCDLVTKLIADGRMQPAGFEKVEAAKKDGRWDQAYDSPQSMVVPDDFLEELAKDEKAKAFFETLNKANVYAIAWRLQTAKKPETRERRMKAILTMLVKGEKLHG
jgi:uncharacterized protein YdeI (YjbR/CyaY-like superfamily)